MKKRIYIGVSGGMDSAAAVLLLKEEGYEVTGVSMQMYGASPDTERLSQLLDIEIIGVDVRKAFEQRVISPFIDSCMKGETPSPCVICNNTIKWLILNELAPSECGIATGHYCRILQTREGIYHIARGKDPVKDQSYYLWQLPQEILSRIVMPLGEWRKEDVRKWLIKKGFPEWSSQKESMGVCFLSGNKPGDFLLHRMPRLQTLQGGLLKDATGHPLGTHKGYIFYTIGQRRGLPLEKGECVIAIDAIRNEVTIGSPADLFVSEFWLRDWILSEDFFNGNRDTITVQVRGVGRNPQGKIEIQKEDTLLHVRLTEDKAWALAQGQPAVFYSGECVVGGGIVEKF